MAENTKIEEPKTNTVGRLFPEWEAAHQDDPKPLPDRLRMMHRLHGATAGTTCKKCRYLVLQGGVAGRFLKCAESVVTRGPGTDWRARWPACGKYEERTTMEATAR